MYFRELIIVFALINFFCFVHSDEELIDLECESSADCEDFKIMGRNVTCYGNKCICNDINGRQIKCIPMIQRVFNLIGKPCPCNIENSDCDPHHGVCLCKTNFIPSFDKLRCIKKTVALNESCEENSQCISHDSFSVCDRSEKICKCQEHSINHAGICLSTVGLEEKCQNDNQCNNKTENSLCSDGRCVCHSDFVANKGKTTCLPMAGYRESCMITDQCRHKLGPGSECYSGNCTCDVRHYPSLEKSKNGKKYLCERYIDLGDYCKEHNDCYQYHLQVDEQSMECFLGECKCRDGFKPDTSNRICITNGVNRGSFKFALMILSMLFVNFFQRH